MEQVEKKNGSFSKNFIKYLPFIITGLVVVLIGLSMIGNFFDLRLKLGDVKTDTVYRLTDLLFTDKVGVKSVVFFNIVYLALPILGCVFVFLGKYHKNFVIVAVLLFIVSAITMIVSRDVCAVIYSNYTQLTYITHDTYFCYVLPIIALFLAGFFALILASEKDSFTISDLTEMGMLIAIAVALNFLKIVQLGASGGSVNFQMLPLFILALRRGPLKGFIGAGIVYGLITCLTDGYGIATFPFDYLVGFGSCCILGFFKPLIFGKDQNTYNVKGEIFLFIGAALASFFRFVGSSVSSMVIYGYTIQAAMAYNAVYVFVSGAISIAIIMAIYGPFIKVNKRYPAIKFGDEGASK